MAFLNNAGLERLWGKITAKLNTKVDKVDGKGLSTNDYTTTEKNKLAGIATGATKVTVDSALSSSSTNPVQNKVVNTAISDLNTLVGSTSVATQISGYAAPKSHTHNYYVKGTQTASTNDFTGVLNEISTLYEGLTINYWLPYAGTNTAATLNLTLKDGSTTGKIPIYYSGTTRLTTHIGVNNIMILTYQTVTISGTSYSGWWLMKAYDSNTISQLRYDNTKVIAGINGIYGYSLIALDSNNKWQGFVKSRSTDTTKTINTEAKFKLPINILYYGAGNDVTNGNATPNTYAIYSAYPSIDLRYSHNYTTNFTVNTPVYLEGTIDSNGYFSVTSTCITQTLTSGKYYIFLGTSGNSTAYQLALHTDHPIYYYNGSNLVDYTRKLYGSVLSVSGKTVALKNGLGEILSSITTQDTTYSAATTSAAGLMSKDDKTKLDAITASADAVSFSRSLTSGTKVGTITINGTGTDLYAPTNTDTHYTTGLKVGASNTATANAAASNGSVYLNVLDNSTVRDSHKIVGSGATTVTSDANGVITVSSTNTTYSVATTSANGLMSKDDKSKLNNLNTLVGNTAVSTQISNAIQNKAEKITRTATISTSWTGSQAPYSQSVTVSGILSSDFPHIAPVYSIDYATALAEREAWNMISRATSSDGAIQFTCLEDKPSVAIPIQIEVMR